MEAQYPLPDPHHHQHHHHHQPFQHQHHHRQPNTTSTSTSTSSFSSHQQHHPHSSAAATETRPTSQPTQPTSAHTLSSSTTAIPPSTSASTSKSGSVSATAAGAPTRRPPSSGHSHGLFAPHIPAPRSPVPGAVGAAGPRDNRDLRDRERDERERDYASFRERQVEQQQRDLVRERGGGDWIDFNSNKSNTITHLPPLQHSHSQPSPHSQPPPQHHSQQRRSQHSLHSQPSHLGPFSPHPYRRSPYSPYPRDIDIQDRDLPPLPDRPLPQLPPLTLPHDSRDDRDSREPRTPRELQDHRDVGDLRDRDPDRDRRAAVHAAPPPLRRLSAPNVSITQPTPQHTLAPPLPSPTRPPSSSYSQQHNNSSSLLVPQPPPPSHSQSAAPSSASTSGRAYLPPPTLPRSRAPAAIHVPSSSHFRNTAFEHPQSAPLVPPAPYHHLQPPRSAGLIPSGRSAAPSLASPTPFSASGVPPRSSSAAGAVASTSNAPSNASQLSARRGSAHLLVPPFSSASVSGPQGPVTGLSPASSASSSLDRTLRSPHPPLTAVYSHHAWPPSIPEEGKRAYFSSPLGDGGGSSNYYRPEYQSQSQTQPSHTHAQGGQSLHAAAHSLLSPAYRAPAPSHPAIYSASPASHTRTHSPLHIPPPLRFKYSASPPPHAPPIMPPRRKAAAGGSTATVTSTPLTTVSSQRSSRRIAGSASNAKGNGGGNGWTVEHTYDSVGHPKEVIVVQDSASPVPKKRTRAAVAAAAAAQQQAADAKWRASNGAAAVNGASAAKKRKVEEEQAAKKKAKVAPVVPAQPPVAAPGATHPPWDDAEGHYVVKPDDVIGGRYKIVRLLGQGTFGKVVEARHIESRRKVAIKVIRAVQKYRDASKIEIRVLETLKKNDPPNSFKCIHLTEYFDYRNHPCLVSDLYGMSVFDFLKQNSFQPFPERHIQDFARSLLSSVRFLHSLKLVHTDLKPENILLVSNESRLQGPRQANARSKSILRNTDIRLIDFGSATFENEYHSSVVSTRHYRAPEIILGLPWSYPCDMFSIGCILVEFFTGDALFQTHDNLEHLAMMEVVMGKMPARMVERGRLKKPEFFKGNKVDFPNPSVSKSSRKFVKGLKSLKEIIPATSQTNALFLDLIVRLLDFDPDVRINVNDALKHPYLRQTIPEPP